MDDEAFDQRLRRQLHREAEDLVPETTPVPDLSLAVENHLRPQNGNQDRDYGRKKSKRSSLAWTSAVAAALVVVAIVTGAILVTRHDSGSESQVGATATTKSIESPARSAAGPTLSVDRSTSAPEQNQTSATLPFEVVGSAQVQPVGPMPSTAQAEVRLLAAQLTGAVARAKPGTLPALPGAPFNIGGMSTVTGNLGDATGNTLTYYWNASSAAPMQKCGSFYFPSLVETDIAVYVFVGEKLGPNASADDYCAADAKAYSARFTLKKPMGDRYLVDVGTGFALDVTHK